MTKQEIETELVELEEKFDQYYQYSDDFAYWHKHQTIKERIQSLKEKLKEYDDTI